MRAYKRRPAVSTDFPPGGIPAYGNSTRDWDLSQPDHPNPEYR